MLIAKNTILFAVTCILILSACSHRAWYDGMQVSQRNECVKEPIAQLDACMQRTQTSYDEYVREREALLKMQ